ncbi:DUF805 domain-containing protein [uncultured Enterovirga sp.]|uniref:DUF805 domain-containing protein n=1 Tax=uncultured Enterovirga sp. TaxID=2026352 RepID=UPI0035CC3BDB
MLSTFLGFGGRIGRLSYFLLTLALAALLTFVIFAMIIGLALSFGVRHSGGEIPPRLLATILVVTMPIYGWFTLTLMAKRFRDIGWDPFVVIVGWGSIAVLDICVAVYVPRFATAHDSQTAFGLMLNLVMLACLLFWPSTEDDVTPMTTAPPRPTRVEALSMQGGAGAPIRASFGRR